MSDEKINNEKTVEETSSTVENKKNKKNTIDNNDILSQILATQSELLRALVNKNTETTQSQFIKIVHLVQRHHGLGTTIQLSNLLIRMENLGEERTLTLQQFEELVGNYRSWFDMGILTVAEGYEDIAERYGLKQINNYPLTSDFMKNLGDISMTDLESVVSKLPLAGKQTVVSYWIRQIGKGEVAFKDIRKVETLNRITNGSMDNILVDLKKTR